MEEVTWHSLTSDHKHCLYILVLEERKFIFHFEAFFEDFIFFFFFVIQADLNIFLFQTLSLTTHTFIKKHATNDLEH